ncbi:multidrug resistance-associated protein 4-like [Anoplophora glabripennis]|uniref:multidrug resistance-associated protein 4-like n=1 Tax=Anoplophora glabripennis TaxID=217634 RepID=UPI0008758A34|nr:multidrug resistance-associated protein 4-like [Anoplophora glabripennis]
MEAAYNYQNPSPEAKANFISKLFFCWLCPFLRYGYRNDVQMKDIYDTSQANMSEPLGDLLERNWNIETKNAKRRRKSPSLLKVIIKTFGTSFIKFGFLLIILVAIKSLQPCLLGEYIKFFRKADAKIELGWILCLGIFLTNVLTTFIFTHYSTYGQIYGSRIKVACSSLLYRKILKLSLTSLSQTASGEIVNLLSNDMQRIDTAAVFFHYIYCAPLQVILVGYVMYQMVGISCFPGMLFIVIEALPIQGYLSKVQGKLRSRVAQLTGRRLTVMNDIVSGIQVIKMYAWEKPFEKIVTMIRKTELNTITKGSYIKGLSVAILVFTERLSLFLVIMTYVLLGNKLTGDVVFSTALLLNALEVSLCFYFPIALESLTQAIVSIKRLQKFLSLGEKASDLSNNNTTIINKELGHIKVTDLRAGWLPTVLTLTDVCLNIRPGTLCCVVGKVGSGKTSLLHLLLKEMPVSVGKVDVAGKISYASQDPWLFVASVRNNILFGQKFLQTKYKRIVKACALYKDFQQFPYRDHTMVGERGVSLSGGQRVRINLARAVYLDADIYLLDDPLSAVDTHVAKKLFEECIKNYLKDKTRILVTHQLQFLRQADIILVLEDGRICKTLKNDEIFETALNQLNKVLPEQGGNDEEKGTKTKFPKRTDSVLSHASTIYEEEIDQHEEISKDVSFSTYFKYLSSGMNICPLVTILVIFVVGQIILNASDMWITYWTNKEEQSLHSTIPSSNSTENDIYLLTNLTNLTRMVNISTHYYDTEVKDDSSHDNYFYLCVYAGLMICCIILSTTRPMLFCIICQSASKALHKKMLNNILHAPIRFFETNPSGRILNRFSKDLGSVDEVLPGAFLWALQSWLVIFGSLIMVCVIVPWMLIPLLVAIVVMYFILVIFLPTLLQIVKLEANNRSPIFSQITATMNGLPTIRSTGAESMLKKYFDFLQDAHTSTWHMVILYNKVFGFYVDNLCQVFLVIVTLKFLVLRSGPTYGGDIGLVITHSSILGGLLQYGIAMTMDVINTMVCVERVLQYINIKKETVDEVANRDRLMKQWPHSGKVTFNDVFLTYVPEEPAVLKNLNLCIRPGEKIGIVGRTGAGKSSLITCLFRLAPIEGSIAIDDIDTAIVDLNTLRSKISIIPQEPVLFSESLRYNIDPLGTASDEALWKVLENVKLKDSVDSLDQKVSNGGSNFSAGQKQLICLARAILRNNKILVMDEATANVDQNTDALIQKTIRENFSNCTVLTIAHRLNTIMDYDRVLVMSSGQAVEFAHPHELLQKSSGYFLQMVQETGKAVEESLRKIAKKDFENKFFD